METNNPPESWGSPILGSEQSKGLVCPRCDWNWVSNPREIKAKHVVGFSRNTPHKSVFDAVGIIESIGALIIECKICHKRFWFHITQPIYDGLKSFFTES